MIRLVFLGLLADLAGAAEIVLDINEPTPLDELIAMLEESLAAALRGAKVKLALNGALVARAGLVAASGDELAFLPPVSGG
ncbi:MAG: MoaD/ThiS family protein [Novosphingobium sp.]